MLQKLLFCLKVQMILIPSIAMGSVCIVAVESPLDTAFRYMESIINKSRIKMAQQHNEIYQTIYKWKRGLIKDISIETLVQMAYFIGTDPSTLLKAGRDFTPSAQISDTDIIQALDSGQPLSLDMLKYLESKETLPVEYVYYLENRLPLHNEYMVQILDFIHSKLKDRITGLQERISLLEGQTSLVSLSQRFQISLYIIRNIIYHHHIPRFDQLDQILKATGIDLMAFFEDIESSKQFQIPFRSISLSRSQELTLRQREKIRFISHRIQQAMDLRGMGTAIALGHLTGLHKTQLAHAQRDITLLSLAYTSFASEIPISRLFDPQPLEDYTSEHFHSGRSQEEIRAEKISGDYMKKFKQAFIHFMRWKINEQNISPSQLSRKSYLTVNTLRGIFITGSPPNLSTLSRIVQGGFEQDLVSFFQEFESYVETLQNQIFDITNPYLRFERSIRAYDMSQGIELQEDLANYNTSYRSDIVESALDSVLDRVLEAARLTSLSLKKIKYTAKVNVVEWDTGNSLTKVTSVIMLAHFFGITPFELLGNQPLAELIKPENFTEEMLSQYIPPSEEEIQRSLDQLSINIQRQKGHSISDQDLQIRLAISSSSFLNPILYGETTANLLKLFQVTEALIWTRNPAPEGYPDDFIYIPPDSTDSIANFYNMLAILLEGVGVQR